MGSFLRFFQAIFVWRICVFGKFFVDFFNFFRENRDFLTIFQFLRRFLSILSILIIFRYFWCCRPKWPRDAFGEWKFVNYLKLFLSFRFRRKWPKRPWNFVIFVEIFIQNFVMIFNYLDFCSTKMYCASAFCIGMACSRQWNALKL